MARESAGFLSLKEGRSLQNGINLRQGPQAAQNMFLPVGDSPLPKGWGFLLRRTGAYFGRRPKPEVGSLQAIPLSPRVLIPMLALRSS